MYLLTDKLRLDTEVFVDYLCLTLPFILVRGLAWYGNEQTIWFACFLRYRTTIFIGEKRWSRLPVVNRQIVGGLASLVNADYAEVI